jgi:hypothetical protein
MNKEIRLSLIDLYIGYACAAFLMYAVGGVSYAFGKTKAKLEITEKFKELMGESKSSRN